MLAGIVTGLVIYYLALRPLMRYLHRRRFHRIPDPPPKGTRPEVHLVYDEVTYDLTDKLLRADDQDGCAVWVVQGPQHLRIPDGQVIDLRIRRPQPRDTSVRFVLMVETSGFGRFATRNEMRNDYPELS